jgi:DNA-binding XRE family transcriptional regulator
MEQDDKAFAAALSLSPASSAGNSGRASLREGEGAQTARSNVEAASSPEAEVRDAARERRDVTDSERVVSQDDNADAGSEARRGDGGADGGRAGSSSKTPGKTPKVANNVRKIRIERMVSKAELARRANLSVLTIDRVERGYGCRMDTKRKILEALGLSLADRVRVFGEEE